LDILIVATDEPRASPPSDGALLLTRAGVTGIGSLAVGEACHCEAGAVGRSGALRLVCEMGCIVCGCRFGLVDSVVGVLRMLSTGVRSTRVEHRRVVACVDVYSTGLRLLARRLFPPDASNYSTLPASEWVRHVLPSLCERCERGEEAARHCPLTLTQRAGDMLFVPRDWGHAVLNLAPSIGLAVEFDGPWSRSST